MCLWRHLIDIHPEHLKDLDTRLLGNPLQMHEHFESICARSNNTVESVEVASGPHLSAADILDLSQALTASAPSLKAVFCSVGRDDRSGTLAAILVLARRCPQLETLQLRTDRHCMIEQFFEYTSCAAQPSHFSLTNSGLDVSTTLSDDQALLFDHATTLEFKLTTDHGEQYRKTGNASVSLLARLLRNPAIEKLTVRGLSGTHQECTHFQRQL